MVKRPVVAPAAALGTPLLGLPEALIADIAFRAARLGAGGALSLTCRAFSKTNLMHAPALRIQLDLQRCDQLLTPRVVAALQARTCNLALTLDEPRDHHTRQYVGLLTKLRKKLADCAALEACKLVTIQGPSVVPQKTLDCSPDLAQQLMDSFPSLTSLSLHNYSIPCGGLASLLSHPQLSLQLQQLDLSSSNLHTEPGVPILASLFHASGLKQLSLLTKWGIHELLLPNLQPLSRHLTQLCLTLESCVGLDNFTAALQPLAQLQVLKISRFWNDLRGLPSLLQGLPGLHTLQLPHATVEGQEQLDALLAATQLTSIQLNSVERLTSSCADVPCSWQQLELTGRVGWMSLTYLPLHSLSQPLLLGELFIDDLDLVSAAVHNLTQACRVPVRIKELWLSMSDLDTAAEQQVELQPLVAALQSLKHCSWELMLVARMDVGVADVATLAPLCRGCTHLKFLCGRVTPSLEFWRQLVQLMPFVTNVVFAHVEGGTSSAMYESLQLMAEQPWARWLDICMSSPSSESSELPACWLADNPSKPGNLRVCLKGMQAQAVVWGVWH